MQIVLRNLTIVVKKFMVRYEQMGPPSLSATLRLQYLSCITGNAMREPCFVKDETCTFYRIISVEGIAVTVTYLDRIGVSNQSWRTLPLGSISSLLHGEMENEVKDFGYLLNPSSLEVFVSLLFQSPNVHIGACILAHFNEIALDFTKVKALLLMTACIASSQLPDKDGNNLRPLRRPSRNTPGSCAAWWRYGMHRSLSNTRSCVKKTTFNWTTYKDWKCHAEEYYNHYLLNLGAPWLVGLHVNTKIIQEALAAFTVEYLIQVRQEARFTLEQFRSTGRVFPRHYGDNICDRGCGYKVSAVEVLKGYVVIAPMRLKTSTSLLAPKLPCCLKGSKMFLNIDLADAQLQLSHSAGVFDIVFSAYSIRASSEISSSTNKAIAYILDESETREGIMVSYLQNGENKELSVLLNYLRIQCDEWIAENLIAELCVIEQENVFVWHIFAATSENAVTPPLKTQVEIQNAVLGLGNFEVSVEALNLEVPWRCTRLCVSENRRSPLITLKNLVLPIATAHTIFVEESHICGVLSSFYALKSEMQSVMLIYNYVMHWLQKWDTLQLDETMNGFELLLPLFIVELTGECAPFKMREFTIRMTLGPTWGLRASCVAMTCDGVLSDTTMHLTIFGGVSKKGNILNDFSQDLRSSLIV
ncbi:putative vacuolar protein sorting-associated protein 13A isoform X4, partial [Trypanosoma conorhini]